MNALTRDMAGAGGGVDDNTAQGGHLVVSSPLLNPAGETRSTEWPQPLIFSITPESGQGTDLRATEVDLAPALGNVTQAKQTDRGLRIASQTGVRRLTPVECERLQGFPDDWTRVPNDTPDSRRYAAIGDAVTVPVAQWIGERLLRFG